MSLCELESSKYSNYVACVLSVTTDQSASHAPLKEGQLFVLQMSSALPTRTTMRSVNKLNPFLHNKKHSPQDSLMIAITRPGGQRWHTSLTCYCCCCHCHCCCCLQFYLQILIMFACMHQCRSCAQTKAVPHTHTGRTLFLVQLNCALWTMGRMRNAAQNAI